MCFPITNLIRFLLLEDMQKEKRKIIHSPTTKKLLAWLTLLLYNNKNSNLLYFLDPKMPLLMKMCHFIAAFGKLGMISLQIKT